jgi:HTH-type transcriptional regulator, glycine betaine synthesis regulator
VLHKGRPMVHFLLNSNQCHSSLLPISVSLASRSTIQNAGLPGTRSLVFERECVRFFEEVVQVFGVPKSVGQIYGLLYASPAPLSFSDIVERLPISKGSASQGLALLRSLGAITEAKSEELNENREGRCAEGYESLAPGARRIGDDVIAARRVTFEPELSLRSLMSGILQERVAPMAATSAERLKRLRELAEQNGDDSDFYLDRAKRLNTWRRRLKTVLPVLSSLLGPKRR